MLKNKQLIWERGALPINLDACMYDYKLTAPLIDGLLLLREENERRVKQVLVELGQDLRLSAEKEVEELQLPMRDADIQRLCKQSQNKVLQRLVRCSF